MLVKLTVLLYILSTCFSATQYENMKIEPFGVIIGRDNDTDPASRWSIGIYIVFGKKRFRPVFSSQQEVDPICGGDECVRAFGICIVIGRSVNGLLEEWSSVDDQNLGNLTLDKQKRFLEEFPRILTDGVVRNVHFATVDPLLPLDPPTFPPAPPIDTSRATRADLLLNRTRDQEWFISINKAELVVTGTIIGRIIGAGTSDTGAPSFYDIQNGGAYGHALVERSNCKFIRNLLRIYYCSKKFYNLALCIYYSLLTFLDPPCGTDLLDGLKRPGPVDMFVKFIRLLIWLINILPGLP